MKYKRIVYTPILLILFIQSVAGTQKPGVLERNTPNGKLERIIAMWNKSAEHFHESARPREEERLEDSTSGADFPSEISNCIREHQYQITQDFQQGKRIILNCFKATLMLNMLRYLGESPKSRITLLNGLLELKRIPDGCGEGGCEQQERGFESDRKEQYVRLYKKAMQKLINERRRLNAFRNQTEEEMAEQLNRIDQNSEAFLSEVVRALKDENAEKVEEEKLKKEISDPKLLSVLDVFSRNYMLKFRFYPGAAARMMRSPKGGFTFDVELQEPSEGPEEEVTSDESLTREIKDGPQGKDYLGDDDDDDSSEDDDDDDDNKRKKKGKKGGKKKKKQMKKKAKALKKIIPYLLLPMLIQMTLLPFVFKKLFFLAMKALFAGKMALILVGFNILRNTCIKNDDDYQKIRVEHYGYGKGEEYGAWINGKSLQERSVMAALSEEPFRGQAPLQNGKSF